MGLRDSQCWAGAAVIGSCVRQDGLYCKGKAPLAQLKGASPSHGPLLTPKTYRSPKSHKDSKILSHKLPSSPGEHTRSRWPLGRQVKNCSDGSEGPALPVALVSVMVPKVRATNLEQGCKGITKPLWLLQMLPSAETGTMCHPQALPPPKQGGHIVLRHFLQQKGDHVL